MTKKSEIIKLLKRRAECLDRDGRYSEALPCYKEGLEKLLNYLNTKNEKESELWGPKIEYYHQRIEFLELEVAKEKLEVAKQSGKYFEQIKIEYDSTGFSYATIFDRFLDNNVTSITVEDPFIREKHQILNFDRFCDLCIKKCSNLQNIELVTNPHQKQKDRQIQDMSKYLDTRYLELKGKFLQRNVTLSWTFDPHLHDREIRFDNGWIIKIGRGLDIYQPPKGEMDRENFSLRKCEKTTVDIFVIPKVTLTTPEVCLKVQNQKQNSSKIFQKLLSMLL